MHSMNERPCCECGDTDGCHLRSRLQRLRDAVQKFRDEFQAYGVKFPKVVCLCGSTRFWREFQEYGLKETIAGRIVLSIGAARCADEDDKTFGGSVSRPNSTG